jgi:alpha 1,6-mannosyltransferase
MVQTWPQRPEQKSRALIDTCLQKNPTYQPTFMTDISGDIYVKETLKSRPNIIEAYLALPIPILKADLLRYLLLFAEGGIWSDPDVSCEDVPIKDWIPAQYKKDASLVVGWEFDVGWGDNVVRQFASWTMMAKPRSPHISMVVDDILDALREKTQQHNVTIAGLKLDTVGDVVDLTGPRRFTKSVLKSLDLMLNSTTADRNISYLLEPKLVGDVLILPGYLSAASANTYDEVQGPVLVTHHYAGTWKNEYGGEQT